ncbi:MAG TPA: glycosyltransferase family 4 protein [Solirubrobacterales bacterium]|jgi:glycosyltransferase involved in cell wall biosynthesis|nr:glycosyltransferase family 4 protein [Solirubrobacterales bacterium]
MIEAATTLARESPDSIGEDPPTIRFGLYAEVNMNLIDGSSVWVQSVSQTLTQIEGVEVTLLLRAPAQRDVLTAPLRANPRIELVSPEEVGHERPLEVGEALDALERLDGERGFDHVFLRGAGISAQAARRQSFPGRLWSYYLTPHDFQPGQEIDQLRLIAPASERVLCQTEPIRELATAAVPEQAEKLTLLPPMIPSVAKRARRPKGGELKLVYAGKFAPEYYFLEIIDTFRRLRRTHPDAELHLIGDKIHNPPADPGFKPAVQAALEETENVVWHGGVARTEVDKLLREADVALSVRHPMMDKELATKVLEYGAAGCAVLLNRTALYEQLLGADYPLFATDPGEILAVLKQTAKNSDLRDEAADRCAEAAREYTFKRVAEQLEEAVL